MSGADTRAGDPVSTLLRVILGTAWAWAAVAKIADPGRAVIAVRAYRILPESLVRPFAWGLPFVELALALLLLLGIRTRVAAILSFVVLAVFVAGMASAWARGLRIDCGCFGGGGTDAGVTWRNYAIELVRDLVLAGAAVRLAIRPASRFALDRE